MAAMIVNQDRCPRIAGTRISVYDVMDYLRAGWSEQSIAFTLRLSPDQVAAAHQYIDEHEHEVTAAYQRILDREAAGNPPELQSRLEATHQRVQELIRRRQLEEARGARTTRGRQH